MSENVSKDRSFEVTTWITNAAPGDEVIYWTGKHCAGPHRQSLYAFAEAGLVLLFQRRVPGRDGVFDYHARRSFKK